MKVAVTGASGFLGRYIVKQLEQSNFVDSIISWKRSSSSTDGLDQITKLNWQLGELGNQAASSKLLSGCDALVHSALARPGKGFTGSEGDLLKFASDNILGSLMLFEAALELNVKKVIFVSTCAVHDIILSDRPLDESHPLWPKSHYGAHKAAIEKFVHSYGLGKGLDICAVRPTGIYGVAHPKTSSKWYNLIQKIRNNENVEVTRGGKEVHAADVAKSITTLLESSGTIGQSFNCYDMYISEYDVAHIAKKMSGSSSKIHGENLRPKNQISTDKLRAMGVNFSGEALLKATVAELLE